MCQFKYILTILLCLNIYTGMLQGQTLEEGVCSDLMSEIQADKNSFKYFYSKQRIPKSIQRYYYDLYEYKFKIANPGKPYNSNDLWIKCLPDKQLIFIAKTVDYIAIVYHQGGRGQHIACQVAKMKDNRVQSFCQIVILGNVEDPNDLWNLLSLEKFSF